MKKIMAYMFAALAVLMISAALWITVNCRGTLPILVSVPEEATQKVAELMTAACDGDFEEAQKVLYGMPDLGRLYPQP